MILNPFAKVFLCSVTPDAVLSLCCAFLHTFQNYDANNYFA